MSVSRKNILSQIPLFKYFTAQQLEELSWYGVKREIARNQVIYKEGDAKEAVFIVLSGLVKTYRTDHLGQESNLSFLKQHETFPGEGLLADGFYSRSAAAIVRTELLMFSLKPFLNFLAHYPSAAVAVIHAMQESIQSLEHQLNESKWPDVYNPGQLFLLKLAEHYGRQTKGELRIGIPMSHDYFASAIGATRDGGDRLLDKLHEEGIAEMKRWGFVIHDVEALRRWRDFDDQPKAWEQSR